MSSRELQTLCECLTMPVVVVGVSREPSSLAGAHITDLTNQTGLLQLTWLMRRARFVVSVDSGPMHMACAVNDHVLGIHTWTDPRKVGPYNEKAWVWKAGQIAHRQEFTDEQYKHCQAPTEGDARRIADFVLKML